MDFRENEVAIILKLYRWPLAVDQYHTVPPGNCSELSYRSLPSYTQYSIIDVSLSFLALHLCALQPHDHSIGLDGHTKRKRIFSWCFLQTGCTLSKASRSCVWSQKVCWKCYIFTNHDIDAMQRVAFCQYCELSLMCVTWPWGGT